MAIFRCNNCSKEFVGGPESPAAKGKTSLCHGCYLHTEATEIPHEEGSALSKSWNALYHPPVHDGLSQYALDMLYKDDN